jgi:hypothetical protein
MERDIIMDGSRGRARCMDLPGSMAAAPPKKKVAP